MTLIIDSSPSPLPNLPKTCAWPQQGKWTYDDFRRLPEDGLRYEIIEGVLYMSPAPRTKHQKCLANLFFQLELYNQEHRAGLVLFAPVDVCFSAFTTVEPDIIFVLQPRLAIVQEEKITGAPDLAVEVLSPSTAHVDRDKKSQVYAEGGVREYWIVDPEARMIEVYSLQGDVFVLMNIYGVGETVHSPILPGFAAAVADICPA